MRVKHFGSLVGAFFVAAHAWAAQVWDMPTPYPATNFHTENIQQFAQEVEQATQGALKITVHPGGSLFKANEIKRGVQTGQAQIGEVLLSSLANENPLFSVDTLPFVATSYDEAKRLWLASRDAIAKALEANGLVMLFSVPWPPQGLYTKREIANLADLKGMKIRAYSPTVAKLIEAMGAQPVTIQAADLPQALATGVVEANLTSAATGYDSKSWEYFTHYIDLQAWLPKNVVFVSKRALAELSDAQRQALFEAAKKAEARGWALSQEKNNWYLEQLRAHGMKVVAPAPTLQRELRQIGEQMANAWVKQSGEIGKAILDRYRNGH